MTRNERPGCESEVLHRLAEIPFLDRLDLSAVSGWSRGAVYQAVTLLEGEGMVQSVPRGTESLRPARHYCLTAAGVLRLVSNQETTVDEVLRRRPVSEGWRRILLERLDAVGIIYRVAAALSGAAHPTRFRWYRAGPLDAGAVLPGGRTVGILRQGLAADRTAFAKRLFRLGQQAGPGAVLLLASDETRLRPGPPATGRRPLRGLPGPGGGRGDGRDQFPGVADALRQRTPQPGGGPGLRPLWRRAAHRVGSPQSQVAFQRRPGSSLAGDTRLNATHAAKAFGERALDLLFDWPWLVNGGGAFLLSLQQDGGEDASDHPAPGVPGGSRDAAPGAVRARSTAAVAGGDTDTQ